MGFVGKEKRKRTAAGTSPKGSLPQFFLYENQADSDFTDIRDLTSHGF